jgi:hypothetical protein
VFEKIKPYLIGFIAGIIISSIIIFCYDSTGQGGSTFINKQLEAELNTARLRIGKLEKEQIADRATISRIRSDSERFNSTNIRLRGIIEEQGHIIERLKKSSRSDYEGLNRLEEIIRKENTNP